MIFVRWSKWVTYLYSLGLLVLYWLRDPYIIQSLQANTEGDDQP